MKLKNSVIDLDSSHQAHIEVSDNTSNLPLPPGMPETTMTVNSEEVNQATPLSASDPVSLIKTAILDETTRKCEQCLALYKASHTHNCFQLVFSLLSKKVDKDCVRGLQSKINQKFMQLALGKKITLLNDDQEVGGDGVQSRGENSSWRRQKFQQNGEPRMNVKKTISELASKLTSCVS